VIHCYLAGSSALPAGCPSWTVRRHVGKPRHQDDGIGQQCAVRGTGVDAVVGLRYVRERHDGAIGIDNAPSRA
jgi:hypothetical protein